ncbi:MAG: hypothetical protein ACPGVG_02530 [Mycobacterium sp.]
MKIGISPALIDLLTFLDEVDELCELLPDWLPDHDERIARIKAQAQRLCDNALKESKDADHDDNHDPPPRNQGMA